MAKIKNLPKHEQPREKLVEKGPDNLRDNELVAILLGTGRFGKGVIELSDEILNKFPKKKLLALNYKELIKINGIGPRKACAILAAFELTKRALEVEDNNLPTINVIRDAVSHLQELRVAKKEHFVALYLNARNQVVHKETISMGTLNSSLVHPREVFKPAIDCLAAGIILAHNHPSGELDPSDDDLDITRRLSDVGSLMGIEIIDHLIITRDGFNNLNKRQLL